MLINYLELLCIFGSWFLTKSKFHTIVILSIVGLEGYNMWFDYYFEVQFTPWYEVYYIGSALLYTIFATAIALIAYRKLHFYYAIALSIGSLVSVAKLFDYGGGISVILDIYGLSLCVFSVCTCWFLAFKK